jgi:hypothetical protein
VVIDILAHKLRDFMLHLTAWSELQSRIMDLFKWAHMAGGLEWVEMPTTVSQFSPGITRINRRYSEILLPKS